MTVKERIKSVCKERGMSVNQLEKECGFGKGYISKLSDSSASISKICEIAARLHVSVDYLVNSQYSPFDDGEMYLVSLYRKLSDPEKANIIRNIQFLIAESEDKKEGKNAL
jgi:transcriptional regulator with XRE-family HTH domain